MFLSKGIAQAKTYENAALAMWLQIALVSLIIGALSNSWWWSAALPLAMAVFGIVKWFRITVVVLLSLCWAALTYKITLELGSGHITAVSVSLFSALLSYGINLTGMIGFCHAIPDFSDHR